MKTVLLAILVLISIQNYILLEKYEEDERLYKEQIYQLYLEKAMAEYDLEIELNKKNYE